MIKNTKLKTQSDFQTILDQGKYTAETLDMPNGQLQWKITIGEAENKRVLFLRFREPSAKAPNSTIGISVSLNEMGQGNEGISLRDLIGQTALQSKNPELSKIILSPGFKTLLDSLWKIPSLHERELKLPKPIEKLPLIWEKQWTPEEISNGHLRAEDLLEGLLEKRGK